MAAGSRKTGAHSNLQSFIKSTTPTVQSFSIPKENASDVNSLWQSLNQDKVAFYHLANLWEQYAEWSAYGVGVPIRLSDGSSTSQYFTPYLSAMQIYTSRSISASSIVLPKNGGEASESDSSSDDSEREKSSRSWDGVSEVSSPDHEGFWPTREHIGHLYFEFNDHSSPYGRLPLLGKVQEIAKDYPGLMNFWSADLSPASWMSVAWYPIYQIPPQGNAQEFSTCFLTYHTISSSFQDNKCIDAEKGASESAKARTMHKQPSKQISLPSFGLTSYKMKESLWKNPRTGDPEKYAALYSAADSWLRQLKFQHHDFNYFKMHNMRYL